MIETSIIWASFCFSAFYILGSLAFNLTSRAIKAPNFSIGSLIMIGAYVPFSLKIFYGYEPYTCLPFAFIICGVTNWIVYLSVFRKLLMHDRKPELIALASLAVSILFSSLLHIWLYYLRGLTQISPMVSFLKDYDFQLGMIRGVFLVSTIIVFSLFALIRLFNSSRYGLILQALFENETLVEIQGTNGSKFYSWSWLFSGGLAGLAGNLIPFVAITSISQSFLIQNSVMASSILGGMGSIFGCFFGGAAFGFVEIMVTVLGQSLIGVWFGEYRFFISIAIIVFLLKYYPSGLKIRQNHNTKPNSNQGFHLLLIWIISR